MSNWLRLKRRAAAPLQRLNDEVIVYADADGALHTVDEEGTVADVGGNGGSQFVKLIGPKSFAYTDVLNMNSHHDLYTPAIGDVLLNWFADPATFVRFGTVGDGPVPAIIVMGQGTAFNGDVTKGALGYVDNVSKWLGGTYPDDALGETFSNDHADEAGNPVGLPYKVITQAQPFRVVNIYETLNQGSADMYFLIATPSAS